MALHPSWLRRRHARLVHEARASAESSGLQGSGSRSEGVRILMSENASIGHIFSRLDLNWRRGGEVWVVRYRSRVLLQVVPDLTHPGIWRVRHPDGRLSDLVNL